jgi:Holliday junction resolvasome RuvABC endonuclease subunit
MKFMKVTQPWQDELEDLALKVETKITKFKEKQVSIESMFTEQVTQESLEQAKGSIVKMNAEHDE